MDIENILINKYELIFEIINRKVNRIILRIDYNEKNILTLEDFSIMFPARSRFQTLPGNFSQPHLREIPATSTGISREPI